LEERGVGRDLIVDKRLNLAEAVPVLSHRLAVDLRAGPRQVVGHGERDEAGLVLREVDCEAIT
jgi:hypothetical protein